MRTGRPQTQLSYLVTGKKRCKRCKRKLPLDSFHVARSSNNGRNYPYSYCKQCQRKNVREFFATPAGKRLIRSRNLKRDFGITVAQYDAMVEAQNGRCAICKGAEQHISPYTKTVRRLSLDHNHRTGKLRGLLCSLCNRRIGLFNEDLQLLRAAISYLQQHA